MSIIVDGYCRVSTDAQEQNTSFEEQEACIREYCAENGLAIGMIHHETYTGYQYRERKKLSLMRERYREGKIQGIVVRTLDRLSRSQTHVAILFEECECHRVTIHCVKEQVDNTPMGKFARMVLAFVSEMEREKIMDRTITGRISKARQGQIVSGNKAPYGYEWRYERDATGKIIRKEIVINWEQAAIVRWVAEQYANGVASWNIVQQLNARGVPSPSGFAWRERTVHRIIVNERYTGKNAKSFAYQHSHQVKGKKTLDSIDLPDGT
jgi:site-specific DNA recombinase